MDDNKIKKDIYHIHDKSYKDLYSKKEIAVDLFKNFVKGEFVKNIKPKDLTLVNKSFINFFIGVEDRCYRISESY